MDTLRSICSPRSRQDRTNSFLDNIARVLRALGVPTVAIFGATDDIGTGPAGSLSRVVREPVECSPCLLRECPIDHRCMTRVTSERVARTAFELLK